MCVLSHSDMSHILNCRSVNDKTERQYRFRGYFRLNICALSSHNCLCVPQVTLNYDLQIRGTRLALISLYRRHYSHTIVYKPFQRHLFHSASLVVPAVLNRQIVNDSLISAAAGNRMVTHSHTSGRHSSAVGKALPSLNTFCVSDTHVSLYILF